LRRFFGRKGEDFEIEAALRRHKPKPREDFVHSLAQELGGGARVRRLHALSRVSFAAAITVFIFGSVGAFGGLGYAASGAEEAAEAVKQVLVPKKQAVKVVKNSPAQDEYEEDDEEEEIEVERATREVVRSVETPPAPLEVTEEREELPFTGIALGTTLAFALGLIALGIALRRMARARAEES
jgi:hypothetical protein